MGSEYSAVKLNCFIIGFWTTLLENSLGRISQNLVVTSVQTDYLIQQYLGCLGPMGAATVDIISKSTQWHETPEKEWHEYQPLL